MTKIKSTVSIFTFDAVRRPFRLAGLLLAASLAAGCSSAPNPAGEGTASPGAENGVNPQTLTIMLDWYPNAVHSFLYAAEEQGYFAEQGLEVDIQMPAETNDALRLAAAGKVDLALSYQPQVLMARAEGIPVQSLAAVVRHPLTHLMVPEQSGVTRPAELEGANIGYSSIPLYEAIVRAMIAGDGGNPDSIVLQDVGYDLIPAIATGQSQAIMGGFINHEALLLEKEGHPVRTIKPSDYGVPDYYELVLVAGEERIGEMDEAFAGFLKAAEQGQRYVAEHPEEALALLLAHEEDTAPLDEEIERESLNMLLPLMDAGGQAFGYQEEESWSKVHLWLEENGLLSGVTDPSAAFLNLHREES